MSELKYTDESFHLSDQPRLEKWAAENSDKDLNKVSADIAQIFSYEDSERQALGADYKGVSLNILIISDPEAYFAKYPHHDSNLSNETVKQYVESLKSDGTTLNTPASEEQDQSEKDSLPSEQTESEKGETKDYWAGQNPQTKDTQYITDDTSSGHFHFLDIDKDGNGWTKAPRVTDQIESPAKYVHAHEVKGFVVQNEVWVKKDKTATPTAAFNVPHTHEINKLTITAVVEVPYSITIKAGMHPGEPTIYRFIVANTDTNINVLSTTIPGTDGFAKDPGATEADIKNLAKAYFKDLAEKYPSYTLKDKIGLFGADGGNVEIAPSENAPDTEPVKIIEFDDQRHSERLFIGINRLSTRVPFDTPSTLGFMILSEKMLRDQKSGEVDWLQMLMTYTVPEVTVSPTAGGPGSKAGQLTSEDTKGAKGIGDQVKENELLNDKDAKLGVWNTIKNSKQFAGNTAFPDLESGVNKLRGSDNVIVSIYGEVLHRVNIRELMVRAMACLVAKLNPGDWVALGCKLVVKETVKAMADGLDQLKKLMVKEWDQFVKNDLDPDIRRKMNKTKEKFQKGIKDAGKAIKKMEKNIPKIIDRKKSDNLTIIDGKDPFSKEFGKIQQRELNLEKNRMMSEKAQVEEFVEDIKEFVDLDKLCDKLGEFINDATKLLFAPGGLGAIKNNFSATFPGIPKPPMITLPTLPTKDIMKELIEAMERAAKELIVSSIVDLVKGIIDEVMSQCEDITNPSPIIPPEKAIGIPELVPNLHGAASPLSPSPQSGALNNGDVQDLGIPPHMFSEVKSLLDWISEYLKPNQLCRLLSGTASSGLLRVVLGQVEDRFERLNIYVKTTTDVHNLFVRLGEKVDQTFCSAIISNVTAIADMCEDVIDNSPYADALQQKGFSGSEIKQILDDDRQRKLDALEKLSDYFVDPDSIDTRVPEALCRPSKDGLIPKNPRALQHNIEQVVETVFDSVRYNFDQDTDNFKDSYIQIGTVVTEEFKTPEPDEDFTKKFRAYPTLEVAETGIYYLLDPTADLMAQAKEINDGEIISDGTAFGKLGPIFKKEQRRMVLPVLQEVIKNSETYTKTTHYQTEDNKIVLKYQSNPKKNPEKQDLEINTDQEYPLWIGISTPTFDLSGINKIIKSLKKSSPTDPEILERIELLEKVVSAESTKPLAVSINYSSLAESIKFDEDKSLSAIQLYEKKVIKERVLPSFEEVMLGANDGPGASSNPGYLISSKISKKATNSEKEKNRISEDSGVPTLITELLKNTWLGEDDLYTSLYGSFDPTKPADETGNSLNARHKNTYKAAKSVLFAKLLSRKLKKSILESYTGFHPHLSGDLESGLKTNNLIGYMDNLDNYLIAIHEKSLINFAAPGFAAYKNSPILKLEELQALDLTPEDPNSLDSNKCLDPNSDGLNEDTTLLNIYKLKQFVKDNYERKGCLDRKPDDLNPLRESMLEAGILSLIKIVFIEYCFNNLIALTESKIFDALVTEEVKVTVIKNINLSLEKMGPDIKSSVLEAAVKYLKDRIDMNIDLVDPYYPGDASLTLTEDNINRATALDYLSKQAIIETIPVLKTMIADFEFEGQTTEGLTAFLNSYLGHNTYLDPPSSLFVSSKQEINIQAAVRVKEESVGQEFYVSMQEPGEFLLETDRYKDLKNIVFDSNYEDKILSFEDDNQIGTFYLEKYVRVTYLNDDGKRFFFLPETIIAASGEDLYDPSQPVTLFDEGPKGDRINVMSLDAFSKIITIQSLLFKSSLLGPENHNSILDVLGISEYDLDKFVQNYIYAPTAGIYKLNMTAIAKNLNFKFGVRLVYKMPSSNLILDAQELPTPGKFTEENSLANGLWSISSTENINKFGEIVGKEASYLIRTRKSDEYVPDAAIPSISLGPVTDPEPGWPPHPIKVVTVKDHMILPVAEAERDAMGIFESIAGNFSLNTTLDLKAFAASAQSVSDLKVFSDIVTNTNISNPGSPNLVADVGRTLSLFPDTYPIKSAYNKVNSRFNMNHKSLLYTELKKTPEVKLLTEYIFSPKEIKSLVLDYMNVFPKSSVIDNRDFYGQTKAGLQSLFRACLYGDDYTYSDPDSDGLQKQKHGNKRKSTNINIFPALQKLALETCPMIIKGMAETVDPAVKMANFISIAAGLPPSDINKVILSLLPPPMFPFLFYNIFPITPLGIAYVGLNFLDNRGIMLSSKKKAQEKECKDIEVKEIKKKNEDEDDPDYQTKK